MLSEKQLRQFLKDRNLRAITRITGISYGRLTHWLREGKEPQFDLLEAVGNYLEENARTILKG